MIRNLLVPLDGSRLGEAALEPAVYIANMMGCTISLIHVVEKNAPEKVHGQQHIRTSKEADVYLKQIAELYFKGISDVVIHVHEEEVKDVAASIISHSDELSSDLIVMCTHGEGAFSDYIYGSIAQQIISYKKVPVLLIYPKTDNQMMPFSCKSVLIPLDGDPDHEQGIHYVEEISTKCPINVHLILAVPEVDDLRGEKGAAGKMLRAAMSEYLDMIEENAVEYLTPIIKRFEDQKTPVLGEICRGDPAAIIIEVAEEKPYDLIVLGTHGKSGLEAFMSGSVAQKISNESKIPLLLIPVHDD
jgi:nucleotide-binding universal stress UspA family protein